MSSFKHEGIDLQQELTDGFAAKLVRRKSWELVGKAGFTRSDREDIEQELKIAVWERFEQFDPDVKHWNMFVTTIVERQVATILEQRSAEKREYCHGVTSLSTRVQDAEGGRTELARMIGEEHLARLTGLVVHDDEADVSLKHDMEAILSKVPAELREVCERLKYESIADVVRELNIPRSKVYRLLEWLRELFEAEGFSG
jgi:RNA polymerase sigma-70 factor, ECF subfamily